MIDIGGGVPGITLQVDLNPDVDFCTYKLQYTVDISCSMAVDTDEDGLYDHLDIDSDNDGIPDNIEAQTTSGFIAKTNLDSMRRPYMSFLLLKTYKN